MTDVQRVHLEFRAWRRRQTFPSEAIAHKAELVENDLRALSGPAAKVPKMRELAARNVAEFAAMVAK